MDTDTTTYKLEELAAAATITPRTVRYYLQRGVLAPPVFRGPDTVYEQGHLRRLLAIKALQERLWSLDSIAAALAGCSTDEAVQELLRRVAADATVDATGNTPVDGRHQPDLTLAGGAGSGSSGSSGLAVHLAVPQVQAVPQAQQVPQVQPAAQVWTRIEIASGIEMWLRHEGQAQQRLLQDAILAAAQAAAGSAQEKKS